MLQWSIRHKPAKHGCDDLCTLLSAPTSCLTPPHPVDNCFFLFFSLPLPSTWHGSRCVIYGKDWQGNGQVPPLLGSYLFAHWGEEREKKNIWDLKGQKKIEVFQIKVWDNRQEWDWKSAKTTVAPAQAACFLQGHDISHTTVTLTGNCYHLILDCLKKLLNETFLSV